MQTIFKLIISLVVILIATQVGKKVPTLAGLIGTMPLTGALIFIWLYIDNKNSPEVLKRPIITLALYKWAYINIHERQT